MAGCVYQAEPKRFDQRRDKEASDFSDMDHGPRPTFTAFAASACVTRAQSAPKPAGRTRFDGKRFHLDVTHYGPTVGIP